LPPLTARVPRALAMSPEPMMLMLLMTRALFLVFCLSLCLACLGSGQARSAINR
jgi:hypothetical protein